MAKNFRKSASNKLGLSDEEFDSMSLEDLAELYLKNEELPEFNDKRKEGSVLEMFLGSILGEEKYGIVTNIGGAINAGSNIFSYEPDSVHVRLENGTEKKFHTYGAFGEIKSGSRVSVTTYGILTPFVYFFGTPGAKIRLL